MKKTFKERKNMKILHDLPDQIMNLDPYIKNHSGDVTETYKTVGDETLNISYYLPENRREGEKSPLVVLIHGGGWGSRKIFDDQSGVWQGDYLGFLARYLACNGFAAVSVDYRLLRDKGQSECYGLPNLIGDCYDAVSRITASADKYGLDLDRAAVLGESAGGYLAAAFPTFTDKNPAIRFKAAVIVNGITDLTDMKWGSFAPVGADLKALSPLFGASDVSGDILLLHGAEDSVVDLRHSTDFYGAVGENSAHSAELHLIKGTNHAFLLAEYYPDRRATSLAVGLIGKYLETKLGKDAG